LDRLISLEHNYPQWDIVLVSGDKSDSLRTVFRNYFQNATEFIRMVEEALIDA
jgi:putative GTP pyrophosphokinase